MEIPRNINILREVPPPALSNVQLEQFTPENLQMKRVGKLDPLKAANILLTKRGQQVLTFDTGGSAVKSNIAWVGRDGRVLVNESKEEIFANPDPNGHDSGKGYLDFYIRNRKNHLDIKVAVSSGGVVENGNLVASANFSVLVEDLKAVGGFSSVFNQENTPLINDAQAGVITSAVGIAQRDHKAKPTLNIIASGGIGGAFMDREGNITAMEPGHIKLIDKTLNPKGVTTPCLLFPGWNFTCLERVAASVAGIEAQWEAIKGEKLPGIQIAEKMYMGDELAKELYVNSSLILANIIEGIRKNVNVPIENISIVLHGGLFKTEGVIDLIKRILQKHYNVENIDMVTAGSLGYYNPCMSGLAISALTNE